MSSNFKIIRHHNCDNLHLKLVGNFDGAAAMELVNVIDDNSGWFKRIFVHTCGLTSISAFGSLVFTKNIKTSRLRPHQLKANHQPSTRRPAGSWRRPWPASMPGQRFS